MEFRTHTGEIVTGPPLTAALDAVADDWAQLSRGILAEDAYASHVTAAEKHAYLQAGIGEAERIRAGQVSSLTIWQRVNEKLTGQCVALLPR